MTNVSLYLLALAEGFAGGFSHCIGMCGVFVVAAGGMSAGTEHKRLLAPERHALFHGGRLFALAALGVAAGSLGSLTHRWAFAQGALAVLVGLTMLLLALGISGIVPRIRLPEPDILGAGGGTGRRLFLRALQSKSQWKPLLIGLFVGLLPCGLTYNVLCAALALSGLSGAIMMLAFGLGTIPGLLTLGIFGSVLTANTRFRTLMNRTAALLMAILGAAFLWRGLPNL